MIQDLEHSIVELKFVSSILNADDTLLTAESKHSILIEVPAIILSGQEQILPVKIRKQFQLGEVLKFKLIPSNASTPALIYKVSYFNPGSKEPFLKEEWVVPPQKPDKYFALNLDPLTLVYDVPKDFQTIKNIVPDSVLPDYIISEGKLIFSSTPSQQTINIHYTGKYFRADVLWDKYKPLKNTEIRTVDTNGIFNDSVINF